MATYTYINSPNADNVKVPTGFVANDILRSPAGTYNAVLQGDGNFVAFYGPDPHTTALWSAGRHYPNSGPWTLAYQRATAPPGTAGFPFIVYAPTDNISHIYPLLEAKGTAAKPTFLRLNNNGTLSLYPGTNGIATGSAIATVGNPGPSFQGVTLTSINYDLAKATYPEVDKVYGTTQRLVNSTPTEATLTASLSLKYANTQSYDWNTSNTVTATISATKSIKVPLIGSTEFSLQLSGSTTISHGESTTSGTEITYHSQVAVAVPGHTTYGVQIFGYEQEALVPFTYTGVYHFADGTSVPASGSGEFEGVSTGVFEANVYPISPPSGTSYVISAPPAPASASGTAIIPGGGSFIDDSGNLYTLTSNYVADENGKSIPGGSDTGKMEFYNGKIYGQDASTGAWFTWNQQNWSAASAPPTLPAPSGTIISPGYGSITDNFGNIYTLTANDVADENGKPIPGGSGTLKMEFFNGQVYGQDDHTGDWFTWNQENWNPASAPPVPAVIKAAASSPDTTPGSPATMAVPMNIFVSHIASTAPLAAPNNSDLLGAMAALQHPTASALHF